MDRTQVFLWLTVCLVGCSSKGKLTVGSKNFTEQVVLGEIVAQHLEHRLHRPIERKLNLGGTLLAQQALHEGDIDLYPEYTGTAFTNVLKHTGGRDPAAVLKQVQAEYAERFHLRWLAPLGFNDTFAMVIRGADARARGLASISDATRAGPWTLGVGYEFLTRPDGLANLQSTYPGLRFNGEPRSMDLGLLYQALGQKQVDLVAGNSTDGVLSARDVVVLVDDRAAFPPYQASLVVREKALAENPGLEAALNELSGAIGDSTIRRLNYEVDGKHRAVADVAAEFLAARN